MRCPIAVLVPAYFTRCPITVNLWSNKQWIFLHKLNQASAPPILKKGRRNLENYEPAAAYKLLFPNCLYGCQSYCNSARLFL